MSSRVLSIIVPCHNEGENIPFILRAFADVLREKGFNGAELILIDNNSKDGTAEILKRELEKPEHSFARTVFEPRAGYGVAIKRGLESAQGEIIAWTHADLQTDPKDVLRAYEEYVKYNDPKVIIKGSRVGRPLAQIIFSAGMALIASVILRKRFFEINAQPKLFHRNFLEHLLGGPDDFSLDLYLLYQAKCYGYQVKTINVFFKKRIYGESKWAFSFSSKFKTIWRTIKYIVKLKRTLS